MGKKTSVYVLSATLAASLGVNVLLAGGGVSEVHASYKRERVVTKIPLLSDEQKSCFEACIDDAVCPSVDTKLGLSGVHSCSAAKNAETFCYQVQRGNTTTDSETGDTSPAPDTASLSGTSGHDMTLTQGRPPGVPEPPQ